LNYVALGGAPIDDGGFGTILIPPLDFDLKVDEGGGRREPPRPGFSLSFLLSQAII
jgi:hypothetical protein